MRGSVIPVVLVILLIVLSIGGQIGIIVPSLNQNISHAINARDLRSQQKNSLLLAPVISGNPCIQTSGVLGKVEIKSSLCFAPSIAPFLEISTLATLNCLYQESRTDKKTNSGISLTDSSIISPWLCPPTLPMINGPTIYNGNWDQLTIDYPPHEINFTGYVNIDSELHVDTETKIFAGGDILINSILTSALLPVKVFLHSRTGKIRVNNTNGVILNCIATDHNCGVLTPQLYWAPVASTNNRAIYFD